MLVSFLLWPIFFVFGLLFGVLSPIVTICKACKQKTGKWQTYVRNASTLSEGHQKRIKTLARCFLVFECFQFSNWDDLRGKKVLLDYYKLGHFLGFSFHIITVTLVKIVLFNPFWTAMTTSLEDLKRMDDANDLAEDLLPSRPDRSGASGPRERPPRHERAKPRDFGEHEPEVSYHVKDIQPREYRQVNLYSPCYEEREAFGQSPQSGHTQNYLPDNNDPSVGMNPKISNDEPWGDWDPS